MITVTVRNVNSGRVFYFHPRNGCYICDLAVVDDDFQTLTDGSDYDASSDSDSELNQMTESQLRDMYSKREVEKFNAVRELEKNLAFPSTSDLVEIVSRGIPGNDVTVTDVRRTDQVLGKNFPIVKGKTTRKKGRPIKVEYVPKHQLSQQTFNSDIMFVNKVPFLVTVSMPLDLTLCTHLTAGKSANSLQQWHLKGSLSSLSHSTLSLPLPLCPIPFESSVHSVNKSPMVPMSKLQSASND